MATLINTVTKRVAENVDDRHAANLVKNSGGRYVYAKEEKEPQAEAKEEVVEAPKPAPKRRGRKPKATKTVENGD